MLRITFSVLVTICILKFQRFASHARSTTERFYKWDEFVGLLKSEQDLTYNSSMPNGHPSSTNTMSLNGRPLASQLIGGKPVYLSLTTIHNRLYGVAATLETILRGSILPTHVYIFVSAEPYLLDQGISKEFMRSSSPKLYLLSESFPHISVVFTDNIGPHRKLLPLLAKKWEEDCVIVTVDDHELYPKDMLASLIDYYRISGGSAVVALRSRRMGICADAPPWRISPYTKKHKGLWPETKPGKREMLMLPTGTAGVLYRPQFFHPIVFDRQFLNLTRTGDDLMFRLATMAKGIAVVTACTESENSPVACPKKHDIESSISTHVAPFTPQLKSIKRTQFETDGNRSVSMSPALRGSSQAGGSSAKGSKLSSDHLSRGIANSDMKKSSSKFSAKMDSASISGSGSDGMSSELDSRSMPAKARTLQQSHEYRLAVLNQVGGLRNRRLSRLSHETFSGNSVESVGSAHFVGPVGMSRSSQRHAGVGSAGGTLDNSEDPGAHADSEGRHKDMRKKESLASKFNALGGNNVMWTHSVAFLHHMGVLDFQTALQYYAPLERNPCVLLSSVFSKGAGSKNRNIFSSFLDSMRISIQNLYNHECGILMCLEDDG